MKSCCLDPNQTHVLKSRLDVLVDPKTDIDESLLEHAYLDVYNIKCKDVFLEV